VLPVAYIQTSELADSIRQKLKKSKEKFTSSKINQKNFWLDTKKISQNDRKEAFPPLAEDIE
jgi:hypothetical protein